MESDFGSLFEQCFLNYLNFIAVGHGNSGTECTHEMVGKTLQLSCFPNSCMTLVFVELEQLAIVYPGLWSGLYKWLSVNVSGPILVHIVLLFP